jgi:hypothetical protein
MRGIASSKRKSVFCWLSTNFQYVYCFNEIDVAKLDDLFIPENAIYSFTPGLNGDYHVVYGG